ncbi:MAG: hypothetical protein A4E30_00059 [Methanomassiliicoccales archaeon PtaB.Bin215]|nr:MAG: hypothetical protein A4E30_00059 [Methanomassiliicoccales archaeon PtaB.Bin215]
MAYGVAVYGCHEGVVAVLLVPVLPVSGLVPAVQVDAVIGVIAVLHGDDVVVDVHGNVHLDDPEGVRVVAAQFVAYSGITDIDHGVPGYVPSDIVLIAGNTIVKLEAVIDPDAVLGSADHVPGHGPGHVHGRSDLGDHVVVALHLDIVLQIDALVGVGVLVDRLDHVVVDRHIYIHPYPGALLSAHVVVHIDAVDVSVQSDVVVADGQLTGYPGVRFCSQGNSTGLDPGPVFDLHVDHLAPGGQVVRAGDHVVVHSVLVVQHEVGHGGLVLRRPVVVGEPRTSVHIRLDGVADVQQLVPVDVRGQCHVPVAYLVVLIEPHLGVDTNLGAIHQVVGYRHEGGDVSVAGLVIVRFLIAVHAGVDGYGVDALGAVVDLVALDGDAHVVDNIADVHVHLGPDVDTVLTGAVDQVVGHIYDRVPYGVAIVVVDGVAYVDTIPAGGLDVVSGDRCGLGQGDAVPCLFILRDVDTGAQRGAGRVHRHERPGAHVVLLDHDVVGHGLLDVHGPVHLVVKVHVDPADHSIRVGQDVVLEVHGDVQSVVPGASGIVIDLDDGVEHISDLVEHGVGHVHVLNSAVGAGHVQADGQTPDPLEGVVGHGHVGFAVVVEYLQGGELVTDDLAEVVPGDLYVHAAFQGHHRDTAVVVAGHGVVGYDRADVALVHGQQHCHSVGDGQRGEQEGHPVGLPLGHVIEHSDVVYHVVVSDQPEPYVGGVGLHVRIVELDGPISEEHDLEGHAEADAGVHFRGVPVEHHGHSILGHLVAEELLIVVYEVGIADWHDLLALFEADPSVLVHVHGGVLHAVVGEGERKVDPYGPTGPGVGAHGPVVPTDQLEGVLHILDHVDGDVRAGTSVEDRVGDLHVHLAVQGVEPVADAAVSEELRAGYDGRSAVDRGGIYTVYTVLEYRAGHCQVDDAQVIGQHAADLYLYTEESGL